MRSGTKMRLTRWMWLEYWRSWELNSRAAYIFTCFLASLHLSLLLLCLTMNPWAGWRPSKRDFHPILWCISTDSQNEALIFPCQQTRSTESACWTTSRLMLQASKAEKSTKKRTAEAVPNPIIPVETETKGKRMEDTMVVMPGQEVSVGREAIR